MPRNDRSQRSRHRYVAVSKLRYRQKRPHLITLDLHRHDVGAGRRELGVTRSTNHYTGSRFPSRQQRTSSFDSPEDVKPSKVCMTVTVTSSASVIGGCKTTAGRDGVGSGWASSESRQSGRTVLLQGRVLAIVVQRIRPSSNVDNTHRFWAPLPDMSPLEISHLRSRRDRNITCISRRPRWQPWRLWRSLF